jgi:hypothetical protein
MAVTYASERSAAPSLWMMDMRAQWMIGDNGPSIWLSRGSIETLE